VSEIVSRSHDLQETLDNVIDLVAKRMDADACSIYLSDAELQTLILSATIGLESRSVQHVRLAMGEGLVGLAAERGEPIATQHASQDPRYRYFPETGEERYESLLAAPLIMQGVTIGVLVIQMTESRTFEQSDVELMQTCAQLLAPVVINAQLLNMVNVDDDQLTQVVSELTRSGVSRPSGVGIRRAEHNVELRGFPTARGVAIGPVHRVDDPLELDSLDYQPSADPDVERRDLMNALAEARREIGEMREKVGERFGSEFAAVFHTQIQILEDKGFVQKLEQEVEQSQNALSAVRSVLDFYRRTFERIEDPYFRERGADVEDVGRRVMENLLGVRRQITPMQKGSVVIVHELLPALFAQLEMDKVAAIVSEHGGATSHGAIFARTLEIPAVTGVVGILGEARNGELTVVDGSVGNIYLSPDAALIAEYRKARQDYFHSVEHLDAMRERPSETRDGLRISISANVGLLNDLRFVEKHGAEGVGLFRTELLALAHRGFPSEEEQEQLYRKVCTTLNGGTATIRTLDLGGDKGIPNIGIEEEDNPQLGCRSIRLTLENRRAFRAQLRAILRASAVGSVRLLFPMISGIAELREARAVLDYARQQLDQRGLAYDHDLPVGVMIEVPSAAMIADTLARECDFFSIGTNDLTQYTLAVDRGNERVAHLFEPLHPAVLNLIDRSVRAARRADIPVSVCGELATNPLAVPILVGLGIGELSGAPSAVPVVKEIVRALDSSEIAQDARDALAAETPEDVYAIGALRLRKAGLLDHPDIGSWLKNLVEEKVGRV
jgi:phosphotransferase system enzyme I (PtsP)